MITDEFKEWLESGTGEFSTDIKPLVEYEDMFEELGYEADRDFSDINGWEVDFLEYYRKDNVKICLSGSLYYGDYKFTKEVNDE
jgi:hypothetical protein